MFRDRVRSFPKLSSPATRATRRDPKMRTISYKRFISELESGDKRDTAEQGGDLETAVAGIKAGEWLTWQTARFIFISLSRRTSTSYLFSSDTLAFNSLRRAELV